ncbi:hypothetical protein K432DRAFT_49846 [Lepidopterella palustris CBS 459.81]|uniref:Uncharacterized protein n=1 Tax=Lepidopterella palustris CBS 459.81 TaxID=1314670 RepID=A0A8E2EAE2_9PEZI|nr:hypothetical protein K432DRAFT_49846 [Lepidopterella palustris CBS 459.81]
MAGQSELVALTIGFASLAKDKLVSNTSLKTGSEMGGLLEFRLPSPHGYPFCDLGLLNDIVQRVDNYPICHFIVQVIWRFNDVKEMATWTSERSVPRALFKRYIGCIQDGDSEYRQ